MRSRITLPSLSSAVNGPFADPGDPSGLTLRTGSWAVQISLNGTADTGVPEPSTLYTGVLGLLAVTFALRRTRNQ